MSVLSLLFHRAVCLRMLSLCAVSHLCLYSLNQCFRYNKIPSTSDDPVSVCAHSHSQDTDESSIHAAFSTFNPLLIAARIELSSVS